MSYARSPRLVCSITIGTRTMPPPSWSSSIMPENSGRAATSRSVRDTITSLPTAFPRVAPSRRRSRDPPPWTAASRRGARRCPRHLPSAPAASAGSTPRWRGGPLELRLELRLRDLDAFLLGDRVEQQVLADPPLGAGPRLLPELRPVLLLRIDAARREVPRVVAQRRPRSPTRRGLPAPGSSRRDRSVSRIARRNLRRRSPPSRAGGLPAPVAEALDRLAVADRPRELLVHRRQPLLLQRGERQPRSPRSCRGTRRWGSRRRTSCGISASPPENSAQGLVDLRHRVGVADLEGDLLVAERPRVLARREDLDERAGDVRHGEVAGRRGAALDRVELGVPFAHAVEDLRSTSSSDGSIGWSSTGIPRHSPGSTTGFKSRLRREADRAGRVPGQVVDAGTAEHRELLLLDRRGERVGQERLEHVLPDLLAEPLADDRFGGLAPSGSPGSRRLRHTSARRVGEGLLDLLGRDLDLERGAGRRLLFSGAFSMRGRSYGIWPGRSPGATRVGSRRAAVPKSSNAGPSGREARVGGPGHPPRAAAPSGAGRASVRRPRRRAAPSRTPVGHLVAGRTRSAILRGGSGTADCPRSVGRRVHVAAERRAPRTRAAPTRPRRAAPRRRCPRTSACTAAGRGRAHDDAGRDDVGLRADSSRRCVTGPRPRRTRSRRRGPSRRSRTTPS